MTNKYIKPETKTIKVELQQVIAQSVIPTGTTPTDPSTSDARSFDFFMEEEEAPGKSDDEDWEDFEDEDYP